MKRFLAGIIVLVAVVGVVHAGYVWEYAEGRECKVGGDVRIRLTSFDRDVNPDYDLNGGASGGPWQYMRVRERVYGCFDITEDMLIYLRLGNRWHYYSSAPWDPNNIQDSNWNFPDEVYVDNLYLDIKNIADTDWSLRLGRQDVIVGNGMIILEGTPRDQGRSIYVDGAVAKYSTECDTVALLGLYNEYKDRAVFINDQNRQLRRGDTWVAGIDWTHQFSDRLNTELLYAHMDIDDDQNDGETTVSIQNAQLNVVSARVYGALTDQVSYSVEAAQEFGEVGGDYGAGNVRTMDASGTMVDARLVMKAAEGTSMSPTLTLQYTSFSGDDADSNDEYEGWHPLYAEYPMFRDELVPWMLMAFNGTTWTNLTQYQAKMSLNVRDAETYPVTMTLVYAALVADYGEVGSGGGSAMGQLASGYLDIGVSDSLSVALEASFFFPGNYWEDGHNSEWLRFQTVYKF